MILSRLPATLELALFAVLLSLQWINRRRT